MKTKGKVVDSTGIQRVYCRECGQLRLSARLGEIRTLQPFVMPLDGELPKLVFVLERKMVSPAPKPEAHWSIPEVDIRFEEYVSMRELSEETKKKIREELGIQEVGELSNKIAKSVREEDNED